MSASDGGDYVGVRPAPGSSGAMDGRAPEGLRPGQDVRFVLAAVGGGGVRIGQAIARRHIRHLETVAINCDPSVQGYDEFDSRYYFGPENGAEIDTGGSPFVGNILARAAEPTLDRIFRGATFVVVVGSLGGGTGSGGLPHILEVASRHSHLVSAFVVKPFRCEGDRRALAERTVGRLQMVPAFVEKQSRGQGMIQVLDNESLVATLRSVPFSRVPEYWASQIAAHIESALIGPFMAELAACWTPNVAATEALITPASPAEALVPPAGPATPVPPLPAAMLAARPTEAELTFEIDAGLRPRPSG